MDRVDPDSPLAPDRQVAGFLREQIENGDLPRGAQLPSIATLTREYGISRTAAAKALRLLVSERLAIMSPGMGTYVVGPE